MRRLLVPILLLGASPLLAATYAEKLGWKPGDRVVILHVDDAGMSHDSNVGALKAIQEGVANSMSVMMPCPWVTELVAALEEDPTLDAGLHLTLTAEWEQYCWGPLAGRDAAPGLVDSRGCMWRSVPQVVGSATP
ncbi:MAG: ChbG/HpnK family deacetylase, partial [Thermoanaerobaculia bacterium]|nr:ChbG/HpnK family deacetylase [Thermoanaerobaculia bacterium]